MSKLRRGNTSHAVRAQRHEPHDSLDDFPTPPWATRALMTHVLQDFGADMRLAWDPAANRGHMVRPLREFFIAAYASDVHDYGAGFEVRDFLLTFPGGDAPRVHWIITNPPFRLALDFALRALVLAEEGVALLVRTQWLAGRDRYESLFSHRPPAAIAQFVERVPMLRGRLDPKGSTATDYAWVVWTKPAAAETRLMWIPPCRRRLERPDDYRTAVA
jgi:hypothetical protein